MPHRVLVSIFEHDEDVLAATSAARERGLRIIDVYTPYAVHGLDRAMGLRPSRLPWVCFLLGLAGAGLTLAFQSWASAVDWPVNVGGRPWNSLPAFVPVAFEVMVLLAGVGTAVAFVLVARLRPWSRVTLVDPRVTDDRFALVLDAADGTDRASVESLLARFHPVRVEERSLEEAA